MDRNEIARKTFNAGQKFGRINGNKTALLVPERLATAPGAENNNIAVALTTGDQVPHQHVIAFGAMEYMIGRLGLNFYLLSATGDIPAERRNSAIKSAQDLKAGWILLLDHNVSFQPNSLPRLWNVAQEHKLDIVGATCAKRTHPHNNPAIGLDTQAESVGPVVEVKALPVVMMLVRIAALEKMVAPYFRYGTVEPNEVDAEYGIQGPALIDDSMMFCSAARRAGLKVFLDVELSLTIFAWGSKGFMLTGSDDPAAPQYSEVDLGEQRTTGSEQAPPADDAAAQERVDHGRDGIRSGHDAVANEGDKPT